MDYRANDEIARDDLYDYLLESGIATEAELSLVSCINGWNLESMESVLFARTGYRSLEQIREEEYEAEAWDDDSDRGCSDCPPEECTGHCMSCYYRPV